MTDSRIAQKLKEYRLKHGVVNRRLVKPVFISVLVVQVLILILLAPRHTLSDWLDVLSSFVTIDALLIAAWQWRAQRLEVSLEAYFNRLNLPNERRLTYYEKILSLGDRVGKLETASALKQFYIFYVYAELDNLEYALTKYVDGTMSYEVTERAIKTFLSRCEQSTDFRNLAHKAISDAGYPVEFEDFGLDLMNNVVDKSKSKSTVLDRSTPFNELDIIRELMDAK